MNSTSLCEFDASAYGKLEGKVDNYVVNFVYNQEACSDWYSLSI